MISGFGSLVSALAFAAAQALYLFAPLLVSAALSAVVLRFELLRRLRRPIDGHRMFRGCRIFGDSKTWRGVAVAVVGSVATVAVQKIALGTGSSTLAVVDYEEVSPFWLGAAMGAGAMLGELPNSFVKRQLGISPGGTTRGIGAAVFYVWDQVDLLIGAWPMILPWVGCRIRLVVVSFAVALVVHPLVALIGYLVGARQSAR